MKLNLFLRWAVTDLLASLMSECAARDIARNYTPDTVGRRLGKLRQEGYPVNCGRESTTGRNRVWAIPRNAFIDQPAGTETDPG